MCHPRLSKHWKALPCPWHLQPKPSRQQRHRYDRARQFVPPTGNGAPRRDDQGRTRAAAADFDDGNHHTGQPGSDRGSKAVAGRRVLLFDGAGYYGRAVCSGVFDIGASAHDDNDSGGFAGLDRAQAEGVRTDRPSRTADAESLETAKFEQHRFSIAFMKYFLSNFYIFI